MASLKGILAGAVSICALAYIGSKTYIYLGVKSEVDDLIDKAGMVAGISYGSISSSLDGSINIDDVAIRPINIDDTLRIDRIRFTTPNYKFLLTGLKDIQSSGQLPKTMGIAFDHIKLDVYGDIIDFFEDAAREANTLSDGCSAMGGFTSDQFLDLGIEKLDMSFSTTYLFYEQEPGIQINARYDLHGIESGELEVALADISRDMMQMNNRKVLLQHFSVTQNGNADFYQKAIEYCADRYETTTDEYLEAFYTGDDSLSAIFGSAIPNQAIRTAFADYARKPDNLTIAGHPIKPIDLRTIHLYAANDIADLLGLTMSVNGKPVENIAFTQAERPLRDTQATSSSETATRPSLESYRSSSSSNNQVVASSASEYPVIRNSDLQAHIGHQFRLTIAGNRTRIGHIKSIKNRMVELEQRMYGGSMTSQIPLKQIQQAELIR